jgi:signal transduction histidine kinase
MKVARPVLAAIAVGVALAVVFVVLAFQLSSNHTRSLNEIKTEVKDRSELTGSLIDSLFSSVQQTKAQYSQDYGTTIDQAKLQAALQTNRYVVITDASGKVLASAGDYNPTTGLALSQAKLAQLATSNPAYYLGDLVPVEGGQFVTDLVVPFSAPSGTRLVVQGLLANGALRTFFDTELTTVPGPKGEVNYIVDGNGRIIAASDPHASTASQPAVLAGGGLHGTSGEVRGSYFQVTTLRNSGWRVLLVAPDGALFSSVNGARELLPWLIFAALVLVAIMAGLLGWRVVRSAEVLTEVNGRLAAVNSELSTANDSLHRRAAELARSNEELDSFASIASHDLQEPLRKVRTFNEQLAVLEADRLSEQGRDYLRRANAAAERMQKLIEDLLKFSRVSTQGRPFEPVDLAEVANRVVVDLEAQVDDAGGRVDIGELPVIKADPLQMQQLLQNLISNALKFRREGVDPVVTVTAERSGETIILKVADNGIGFEARYASRIFRIFERLHGRTEYPGTGIGLALCRKIADRHGGTIEAESEPGQGATFIVTLPADQPEGSYGFGLSAPRKVATEEVEAGAGV